MGREDQLLFVYGTLRRSDVQLDTFGRLATGSEDVLPGYRLEYADLEDPGMADPAGRTQHAVVRRTGDPRDKVVGTALEVTTDELDAADEYEMSIYRRAPAVLATGRKAWVYVAGGDTDGAD